MSEISNPIANFNDLTTDITSINSNQSDVSPALIQGNKFKRYQNQIIKKAGENVNSKEGFQGSLTKQTNKVINENDYSSQQATIQNLKQEYKSTLVKYEKLVAQISGTTSGYLDRVNPNNPYLNKTVRFTTEQIAYVTNQGVVKYVPSMDIWNSTGIPKTYTQLSIPWDTAYNTAGVIIPTKPPLLSGTFMVDGQSVGNEGTNVFVNKLMNTSSVTSTGCYADNTSDPLMTFIGGSPPPAILLQNGTFSSSTITTNSYQYLTWNTTLVPGWNFNCVFINNSSAWGYPMPYPNGNQSACIQKNQQLWTSIYIDFSPGVAYTLTFSACGRNCCDGSGQSNPIDIGIEGVTFYTLNAAVNKWATFSTTFTPENPGKQRLSFIGTWTAGDRSTAIQNISLTSGTPQTGSYTYENCKSAAIDSGNQYFALQNVNASTSTGFCAVSNSEPAVTSLGLGTAPNKTKTLWSSKTPNQTGNSAILTTSGSLSVVNSGGQSVFSSPNTDTAPSNYLGCYGDKSTRAMPTYDGNSYNLASCNQLASEKGATYFGLQYSTSGENAQCFTGNSLSQAREYGKATNCTKISDGSWSGGGWSNAVYNTSSPDSNYYLILQDDGNMCIYRGTGPNDDQGLIWCSNTENKQQDANPNYVATKGKYGTNWIPQGSTLAAGDFVGSTNGNIVLSMQSDGNLVLYTFTMGPNCIKMANGKSGGNAGANAVYNLGTTGVPSVITDLAYIDQDSALHTYPSSNTQYSNKYTKFAGTDSVGADITGASQSSTTVKSCEDTCNSTTECAGFTFSNGTCYPKTSSMYPNTSRTSAPGVDLYMRGKIPITAASGISQTTKNIDSIRYQNYVVSSETDSYGLANATSSQQQQLSQLQTQLDQLTLQLTKLTGEYGNGSSEAESQVETNVKGVQNYLNEIKLNDTKIKGFNTTMDNILNDSDIVVLQKNYDYLFWSILAIGSVIVSMNIMKK